MLAGPIGAMALPLTDDAPKVTKEIVGHALELTIHHPTIGPKICNKWITVDTIIDAIRAAAVIDTSMWKEEVERVKNLNSFRSLKSNDIPQVEHLLEQEKKGSSVQRRATYCVNPQNTKSDIHERQQDSDHASMPKNTKSDNHERQQDSDHVDMPRQQSVCGTYWIRQRPTSFSVSQPLRDASNYFREHNNLKAGGIWSMDEIQIMFVRIMTN
ncbi:hypothetical protein IV203_003957 [Nitzschia inconspicua]|uniref:Uncharacterized protein n=1 Tax=Nitzschia inconspicua TaxID=303405 RepID=A0A9K3L4G7_9STRA|nr:hypothetical protein IV203_003957 [Nitzschia inconspicua]